MNLLLVTAALLLAWMGIGWIVLRHKARPVEGDGLVRRVSRNVLAVGDDVEVELELRPPVELGESEPRDLMLVIDRSGSMGSGPASRMGQAVGAAKRFLDRCPESIRVGLVLFNHQAERRHPLDDAASVRRALGSIRAGGGTSIADGLEQCRLELLENGRSEVLPVVLLLSDGFASADPSLRAAEDLRRDVDGVEICAAALGKGVDRQLLAQIAGGGENVFPVASGSDFDRLFGFLARRLSSETALAVSAVESIRAPRPFELVRVEPATTDAERQGVSATCLGWHLPVWRDQPVRCTYRLVPECPGWHSVAQSLSVTWTMPDGTTRTGGLSKGPRVLALPPLVCWAWTLFNPLLFLLLGDRFCAGVGASEEAANSEFPPLPRPSLPAPLPAMEGEPFRPDVRPALVVGLGEVGETALCRLRHRLDDRGVSPDQLLFRCIDLERPWEGERAFGGFSLAEEECLELSFDFFPYLEGLRRSGAPASRRWIPWRRWLASSRPQSHEYERDRRRSRLAALELSDPFEGALGPAIEEIREAEGRVFVVGSLDDPVASGLVGEVLHLCATAGAGSTVLLAGEKQRRKRDRTALARELGRFLLLRGDEIASDRTTPPALARRLVDRLVVLPAENNPGDGAVTLAEMLYCILAWQRVEDKIPTAGAEGELALVTRVRLATEVWPLEHLWRWVRDRTLVRDVACHALGWSLEDRRAKEPDPETVERWVETFWSAEGTRRPASILVTEGRALLGGRPPEAVLVGRLPYDLPLHEQETFHRRDRDELLAYLEDWSSRLLDEESGTDDCVLIVLEAALHRLEADHRRLVDQVENLRAHATLAGLGELGSDLFEDQLLAIQELRGTVAEASAHWVDPGDSVATRLVDGLRQAERSLEEYLDLELVRQRAEAWADRYGPATRRRIAFGVTMGSDPEAAGVDIWIGDQKLAKDADPALALRQELDRYRGTVGVDWLPEPRPRQTKEAHRAVRLGGCSKLVFPDVERCLVEEDPAYAACLALDRASIDDAFGVAGSSGRDLPFVWPEEANAVRLANWLRREPIAREPVDWSARVVNLLRDPDRLLGFLAWLANGRIEERGEHWSVRSGGGWRALGDVVRDDSPRESLEVLEDMARRVVSLGRSLDGEPVVIEDSELWTPNPINAPLAVERHPAVKPAVDAPGWQVWRDVIQALVLERQNSRASQSEST